MKRSLILVLFLLIPILLGVQCNTSVAPQPTPQETKLKFWAEPQTVQYDTSQQAWVYDIYVSVEGNQGVTLLKLDVYEKENEGDEFVYVNTYDQSQMGAWPGWKNYLSPSDMIRFTAVYNVTIPPYQKKFILYGKTDDGKDISAKMVVTYLPKP